MEETKMCPACAEEIKIEAKKCRYCKEDLDTIGKKDFFKKYKNWLATKYPSENIINEDLHDLTITLTRKHKSFNWFVFVVLLIFGVLPGIIYAIATLQEKNIKTVLSFNDKGEVIKVSNGFMYLKDKYNKIL